MKNKYCEKSERKKKSNFNSHACVNEHFRMAGCPHFYEIEWKDTSERKNRFK